MFQTIFLEKSKNLNAIKSEEKVILNLSDSILNSYNKFKITKQDIDKEKKKFEEMQQKSNILKDQIKNHKSLLKIQKSKLICKYRKD